MTLDLQSGTVERFRELRAETNEEDVPEMTDDLFMHALMDTLEAARSGYYVEVRD